MSTAEWDKYKTRLLKEKLAELEPKLEDWTEALIKGEVHFMGKSHIRTKEGLESMKRRKKRKLLIISD